MPGAGRIVRYGDVELATEAFGDETAPATLLMMGATASMLWWPDAFCEALAGSGSYVIRYDNRDTGRSTTGAPGAPAYTIDDMADDAVAILDAYGVEAAHLVGMSLGGMIAQLAALKHPSRVVTLTAISSARFDEDDPDLPPMDPALLEHFVYSATLDWRDRQAVVEFCVQSFRISAGRDADFDEARARTLAQSEYDRAINPQSAFNHSMLGGGESWAGRLGEISVPLLVIHGRKDPILSFDHARRLADVVPGARLMSLDAAGHELNPRDWDRIVAGIAALRQDAVRQGGSG